jgi:hypothetical protein
MSNPARTLARGRKISNWLSIALVVSVLFNIATPIYYFVQSRTKDRVVVFDLASGSLLLSPLVDPGDSKEILDVSVSWVVKAILDRSAAGLENDALIPILLDRDTARKAREEFDKLKNEYTQKNLRSHVEIKSIDAQPVGDGTIKAKVTGQVILTGTLHGTAIQQVEPVAMEINLARNPDLGRNRHYPLMCFGYAYTQGGSLAKQ